MNNILSAYHEANNHLYRLRTLYLLIQKVASHKLSHVAVLYHRFTFAAAIDANKTVDFKRPFEDPP